MTRQDAIAHLKRETAKRLQALENLQKRLAGLQKQTGSEFLRQDREHSESSKNAVLELTKIS